MVITGHKNFCDALIPRYNMVLKVYRVYNIVVNVILLKAWSFYFHISVYKRIEYQ